MTVDNKASPAARPSVPWAEAPADVVLLAGPSMNLNQCGSWVQVTVDCKKLANPFNVSALKALDGLHWKVREWMRQWADYNVTVDATVDTILKLEQARTLAAPGPIYVRFMCVGGRHRSPAAAWSTLCRLAQKAPALSVVFRRVPPQEIGDPLYGCQPITEPQHIQQRTRFVGGTLSPAQLADFRLGVVHAAHG